ncbi:uncharacterized protein LOC129315168 [Prosopis cineraria]|uniref:uncharacterized protein LOC129315168 n=1 Tax=Prosopis cineraria TaxID=364024 RepID=UPI00240F03B6|nr:uncharacterized protein LOC129315168 [Prosopis cineraria]
MKNVSRSSRFSSCFRLHPPPSLHRSSSVPLPPKLTFSLLLKALAVQTFQNIRARPPRRRGSKRRSSRDGTTLQNPATRASNVPETKASNGLPSCCWRSGSESENLDASFHSNKPGYEESRREGKSGERKKSEWLGICLVALSLTLTVMLGKYWGALLTWAWLYLLSLVKVKAGKTTRVQ